MILKKAVSILLTVTLLMSIVTTLNVTPAFAAGNGTLPTPIVDYNFEDSGATASMRHNADIITDDGKGSNVLELKGGNNGTSFMELPSDLLSTIGQNGLTISTWVKASTATGNYSKVFSASSNPLGVTYDGGNSWNSPDFALAAGGGAYDLTLALGAAGSRATLGSKVNYNTHLKRDTWQYLTLTMSTAGLQVYINGSPVTYADAQQGSTAIATVLQSFLGDKDSQISGAPSMKNAAIGRSQYTSDKDFQGLIDDFSVYGTALTADQVSALYNTFPAITIPAPALNVDMTASTGSFKHGASGFLYGLGEDNVPSANTLTPLKPHIIEQNAPSGLQHPSGDALTVANTFAESGGDLIQVACPDIYANWPYENNPSTSDANWQDYAEKLRIMVTKGKEAGLNDKLVYVPYNEPEGNWFPKIHGNSAENIAARDTFNQFWLKAYDVIKAADPNAKLAGPNLAYYGEDIMNSFVKFCVENNRMPDQFTWHVLDDGWFSGFDGNMANYRSLEQQYGFTREVVINEYGNMKDMGNPGKLVKYLGLWEDYKVSACEAYWHISNNLSDTAADNNEPNATWWMYKWYGGMSGNSLKITQRNTARTALYGVASLDNNKKLSDVLFGGVSGTSKINLLNVSKTDAFKDATKVKVKLETTTFVGINGISEGPSLIKEEVCPVDASGNVILTIDNMDAAAAYNITVTPAGRDEEIGVLQEGAWHHTYEAETSTLAGKAALTTSGSWTCSGSGQVANLNDDADSVTITADVPKDGWYQFDMVYGAATGNDTRSPDTQKPLNGALSFSVDGAAPSLLTLPNTLTWFMSSLHSEKLQLTAGKHTFKLSGVTASKGKASLDCVYLTYKGDTKPSFRNTYEAEMSDFNVLGSQGSSSVMTKSSISGYSGSGYVTGLNTSVEAGGGVRFTTHVNDNGLYDVTLRYSSNKKGNINLYLDNTAKTLNNKVTTVAAPATRGEWKTVTKSIYLQKGLNLIDVDASGADLAFDNLVLTKTANADQQTTGIEAENCKLSGLYAVKGSNYSSGNKYVEGFIGDNKAGNALTLTYTASKAGNYKMAVYQSNDQLFGGHAYNAQMVDRYITISVNGGTPRNIYFRNTYSAESFKSQVISLSLNKGVNTIKIWNDDKRVLKNGVGGVNTCINYTPNLDKFEITPAVYDIKNQRKSK